jgi:hypothetical protein
MKIAVTSVIVSLFIWVSAGSLFGQDKSLPPQGYEDLPRLSESDSLALVNLPELSLPEDWQNGPDAPLLPVVVDNSTNIYWRPVFSQVQFECGQASAVGLGFTYAINRMRDLPSDVPENQYPSHFTWNFGNGGNGWYGVSYFHSLEIIKREGNPNVIEFGGMTGSGPEMWMTGYDKYYSAMHNRVADVYKIDLTTETGVNTLKHWLHNHLEGSDVGGVANFYTNAPYGMQSLPSGTPEAGKYVITSWSYANHALCISGYHDSICWDYNNDGQYTNNIDLNGDGEITPQDWEIGGFRFANTYSGGPSWANNGFCYMTYKSCADEYGNGGIWDNAAHVMYAKANTTPLLTAKIKVNHNCRNRLRIQMGMSTDVNAETPDYVLGFPVFDYQGGCQYMQGGTSNEDNKTIEIGLDITPFLNMIDPGTPARYFLLIDEDDPEAWAWGQMLNYSILDYTGASVEEIVCEENNITLTPDGLSTFWVNHTVDYEGVEIAGDTLPSATVYEPYTASLEAVGGSEPYTWSYDMNFTETVLSESFPQVDEEQLYPSNNNSGFTTKSLNFSFPFYGKEYDAVRVNVDGYISFGNVFEWPYMVYDFFNFTKNKLISPFQADLKLFSPSGDGIWYEGDENSATFRWKASVNGFENTSELNFAVELFKDGNLRFYFGETNEYPSLEWISGISSGDNIFYQFTEVSGKPSIVANTRLDLKATVCPEGFYVDRSGEVHGTALQVFDSLPVKFRVIDENNLTHSKVLYLSTDGSNYLVIKNVNINAGGDDILEFGEEASLSIEIESLGQVPIYGAEMSISDPGMYATLLDSTETLGDFQPGEIKTFENAFSIQASNAIPDNYELDFPTLITDDGGEDWASHIYLMAYAPEVSVASIIVDDGGSGGLDPGESADLIVTLHNAGGAAVHNLIAILSSQDPYITINSATAALEYLNSGASDAVIFNVTASESTPPAYIMEFDVLIEADNEYSISDQAYIVCGLLLEGFESGDFNFLPWEFQGNAEWILDQATTFEGSYSARSGVIGDEESSVMELELLFLGSGDVSFYKKVSSEASYDFLRFYIDGIEMASWDGDQDWTEESFTIAAGMHTLAWAYEKDYSVSGGSDCGWIDNITLPPFGDKDPELWVLPTYMQVTVLENTVVQDTLSLFNAGTGVVLYSIEHMDTTGTPVSWLEIENSGGGLNPGNGTDVLVNFDAGELQSGLYEAEILVTDHLDNTQSVPVWLYVDLGTGLEDGESITEFQLAPNPFSRKLTVEFSLYDQARVTLDVFNIHGEQIASPVQSVMMTAGDHRIAWDGTDYSGRELPAGVYFLKISNGENTMTGKVIKKQ